MMLVLLRDYRCNVFLRQYQRDYIFNNPLTSDSSMPPATYDSQDPNNCVFFFVPGVCLTCSITINRSRPILNLVIIDSGLSKLSRMDYPQCPPAPGKPPVCCQLRPGEKECCDLGGAGKSSGAGGAGATPSVPPEIQSKLEQAFRKLQSQNSKSLLKKYLTPEVFEKLKDRTTPDGSTLLDVIQSGVENPDSGVGIYAPDPDSYTVFEELFDPVICDYHEGFQATDVHPPLNWGDPSTLTDLDPQRKYIKSTRVRCGRSIQGYPFNPKMTLALYLQMEKDAEEAFKKLDGVHEGKYEPLSSMTPDRQQQLVDEHYLFKKGDRFLIAGKACQFWPKGRGIFMNPDKTFLVWVGEEDHLRIISMQDGGDLGTIYKRMVEGVQKLEKSLKFVRHPRLGFITFCPTNLGTTVRASVMIKLPKIGGDLESLEQIASRHSLQVRGTAGEHSVSADGSYDISNKRRLGLTEYEAVSEMHKGLTEMIKMEENA